LFLVFGSRHSKPYTCSYEMLRLARVNFVSRAGDGTVIAAPLTLRARTVVQNLS